MSIPEHERSVEVTAEQVLSDHQWHPVSSVLDVTIFKVGSTVSFTICAQPNDPYPFESNTDGPSCRVDDFTFTRGDIDEGGNLSAAGCVPALGNKEIRFVILAGYAYVKDPDGAPRSKRGRRAPKK
ncbi:MAG: hypothetical protein JWL85_448 [Candidatus Saccharibacteria bacterium]|nr:hypothetical protein [Candidatus Saccharibacteria bacterium]